MANITTCTLCGACYEAGSEEQANEPRRFCASCWNTHGKGEEGGGSMWHATCQLCGRADRSPEDIVLTNDGRHVCVACFLSHVCDECGAVVESWDLCRIAGAHLCESCVARLAPAEVY